MIFAAHRGTTEEQAARAVAVLFYDMFDRSGFEDVLNAIPLADRQKLRDEWRTMVADALARPSAVTINFTDPDELDYCGF